PLSLQSMSGAGWTCSTSQLQCTRSDALAAGASYPAISIAVNVTSGPASAVSQASVSGGGAASATGTDTTTILASYLKFTTQPVNGTVGVTLPAVVVQVQDSANNPVTTFNGTIAVVSNPAGAGSNQATANGVATFSNLVIN